MCVELGNGACKYGHFMSDFLKGNHAKSKSLDFINQDNCLSNFMYINTMDKLSKLLAEQYHEQKEKYDLEKVQEEMWRLIQEQGVDNMLDNSQ